MSSNSLTIYGIIYKITNLVNGKTYIGQTKKSLITRWKAHCTKNGCSAIYKAITKYGKHDFEIIEIDTAFNKKELDEKEVYWIKQYDSFNREKGYNLTSGGSLDRTISDESKAKMSTYRKNKKMSEETKVKISKALKSKVVSKETIEKFVKSKTGMKYNWKNKFYWNDHPEKKKAWADRKRKYKTKEEKNKVYSNIRKNKRNEIKEAFYKKGKVIGLKCLTTNQEFKTYTEAAKKLNINVCSLREHVQGLYSQVGGYKFEAIHKMENEIL